MIIGYARVSTREQDLSGQLTELRAVGCVKVYSEKASGARGDRAELRKLVGRLMPGDVLIVTRLDRLARSTRDLLNVLDSVKQAGPASARSRIAGPIPRPLTGRSCSRFSAGLPSSSAR